jgi:ethanolamine permease
MMVAVYVTLFCTTIFLTFTVFTQSPGTAGAAAEFLPLSPGYIRSLKVSHKVATGLAIPGTFTTAFGFQYTYGKLLHSMAESKVMPSFLKWTVPPNDAPAGAIIGGSVIGFLTLVVLFYKLPEYAVVLFNVCILGSCVVYVLIMVTYAICHYRYSNLKRQFRSPLGFWGAIVGIFIWILVAIAVAFFQEDNYEALEIFLVIMVAFSIYYFAYVQHRQFFSEEEQKIFMTAYIMNANQRRQEAIRRRTRKRNRVQPLLASFFSVGDGSASMRTNRSIMSMFSTRSHNSMLESNKAADSKIDGQRAGGLSMISVASSLEMGTSFDTRKVFEYTSRK